MRAAYLHVLADALTSVLAIVALLLGQRYGWSWLDPVMGLVGAVVIVRWGRGLLHSTADVLLDAAPSGMTEAITQALGDDVGVLDLHVWQIGPGQHAAIVALSAARPASPAAYKARLTGVSGLAHVSPCGSPRGLSGGHAALALNHIVRPRAGSKNSTVRPRHKVRRFVSGG